MNRAIPGARILLIAFSLSNLMMVSAWRDIVSPQHFSHFFYWKRFPGYALGGALAFWILLLTGAFCTGYYLLRRAHIPSLMTVARFLFLALFVRALNQFRAQVEMLSTGNLRMTVGRTGYAVLIALFFAGLAAGIWLRGLRQVTYLSAMTLLAVSPLGFVYGAQAAIIDLKYGPAIGRESQTADSLPSLAKRSRIVWIIFDEMDEGIAFVRRPTALKLPQFDRLRAQSLSADNAFPPAGHTTLSIPALLTGQPLSDSNPTSPETYMLSMARSTEVLNWKDVPDIFSAARDAGINTALVGWAIPYCRILGDRLNSCYWHPAGQMGDPAKESLARNVSADGLRLLDLLPFEGRRLAGMLQSSTIDEDRSQHREEFSDLLSHAESVVADPRFGCVFIHLPVPHPPYIGGPDGAGSYLDNLALADTALGRLRRRMEDANLWNDTTIIVSADHWWRWSHWNTDRFWNPADAALESEPPDHRVPFIVKFAAQTRGVTYNPAFNTVLTHDMALDILQGRIADAHQAALWLREHISGGSPDPIY